MKNFNIQINEKKNHTEVLLTGNLTINNSEVIHKKILSVIEKSKKITIHLDDIDNIDLTIIQLLYSAKRTILKEGKELSTITNLPADLSLLLEKNGLKNIFN
ncbi:MAG: STAS domain-containing protein [Sporocytophaga sp.]|uniref:STAS domain-containing protein n=1 Tax=Sporocytophaga sp. TaxID=2231183 RepID=UPI001B1512A3|nr:STAS domain-containing protein [Sporocytophaga sp.]MBO9703130.1 STAS domain-containing protein [Sporocytophaga sp.]